MSDQSGEDSAKPRQNPAQNLPQQSQNKSVKLVEQQIFSFSGPLPPPEILKMYNDIVPNGADRIMTMTEKQSDHRQFLEKAVISKDSKRSTLGLIFGFIITFTISAGSIWLLILGKSISGLSALAISLGTLAGVFLYANESSKKERLKRSKNETE